MGRIWDVNTSMANGGSGAMRALTMAQSLQSSFETRRRIVDDRPR
jgi:hypothetical protein